jgi:phenylacetate-CoA ligase
MRIWDKKYETMPIKELEQVQLERLQSTIYRIYRHEVAFYKKCFDDAGIVPENFGSLEDLERLPFTTREDLKSSYPYDMFAVPLREVVRIHEASGDVGIVGYTKNDLLHWSSLVARVLCSSGIDEDDTIQITHPYGLFPSAFGYHSAAELIGASVIPTSTARTDKQIKILQDYRSTALVSTPSYARRLVFELEKRRVDPKLLSLTYAILGSEPWTDSIRNEIEERLFVSASFNYGVATIFGPGVATECREKRGLHIFMDHYIPEIIDPKTGRVLPRGEEGELVLTTLTREAFPIIRYKTGDITRFIDDEETCPCGRTHIKMEPVKKRVDDLIVFQGINIYPHQIEGILSEIEGIKPTYRIVLFTKDGKDYISIETEVYEELFFDEMKVQRRFVEEIEHIIERILGITASVKLVEPGSTKGKKRIEDRRK